MILRWVQEADHGMSFLNSHVHVQMDPVTQLQPQILALLSKGLGGIHLVSWFIMSI
jgi:hypothetical protein